MSAPGIQTEIDALARLRLERDRFVGFAFAGGDLLLETDQEGIITYAAGAASALVSKSAAELIGGSLRDLASPGEQAPFCAALAKLRRGTRFGPALVLLGEGRQPAWLGGYCLPDRMSFQLSLRPAFMPAPALAAPAERARFERHLLERLTRGSANERLMLLDLQGLQERSGPEDNADLRAQVGALLQKYAVDADASGWIAADKAGVVHTAGTDPAEIERSLNLLARAVDPDQGDLQITSATLDLDCAGLSAADSAQALVYSINQFVATSGTGFTLRSLRDSLDEMVKTTVARMAEIRDTARTASFDLAFQPIVELRTRRIQHYEALVRLANAGSPYETVNFAEQVGVVADLDLAICQRVLETAARDLRPPVGLALNLSARSLETELFTRALLGLLNRYKDLRGRIVFELTESAAIRDVARVVRILSEIRERGFAIALDDFGTGATSFDYLRMYRFDYVKIDGSYIKSTSPHDQAILRSMVQLCRELSIKCIAEMVETPLQAQRLARLQVSHGQGYLFGRPGPLPAPACGHSQVAEGEPKDSSAWRAAGSIKPLVWPRWSLHGTSHL